ncbi:hypothetical protein P691DRAFT_787393 [Macrolepiota fuliginosa MF-IS2]|uniref:Uncharacterized protein n=1 Tax=Macrolepiota fuliginosa MF-IS2 TaxID=1400762 RepID=A0A9P5X316_9AGAR|nr:hypothetical protein P691DRAFT_787393 [Macrolepiota fuliginosa MF-IS2]
MPPRPSVASKASRPLSAIFIGNQSNGTNSTNNNGHASSASISSTPLPDLPEPPSPVSSVGSGLPSPPATNSTGSGSTGDPGSVAARRPPASMASDSSRLSDDPDIDEDHTMRLKIGTNESVLQRARSLAQRNKLQLDKIASSRLGRASPAASHRHSMPDPSQVLSGSETERENDSAVFNSTSTSSSSKSNRVRLSSAPSSPHRARTTHSGTSSPTRRRKRVSLAFDDSGDDENYERRQDPQRAPTVSLNSAKKTSLGSTRRRSALPREFREGSSDDVSQ